MAKGAGGKSANKFAKAVAKEHPVQNNGRNLTVKQRTAAMKRDNYGLLTKEKQIYSILRGDPPQTLRNKMDTDLTKHEAGEIFIKWGPTHPADNWSLYSLQGEEMAAVKEAASEALPDQVPEEHIDSKLFVEQVIFGQALIQALPVYVFGKCGNAQRRATYRFVQASQVPHLCTASLAAQRWGT